MTNPKPSPETLLTALLPLVAGWCRRLGGHRIDVEAADQDTMMVLLRRADDLRPGAPLEPWAWGVTVRVVQQHRRRAWWRRWWPGEVPDRGHLDSPEARMGQKDLARQVQQVLDVLDEAHSQVLILCDAEERTAMAAAAILEIPSNTVKSRLRVARAAFRAEAERQGLHILHLLEEQEDV